MSSPTGMPRSFMDRLIAAARLDVALYEEVEADTTATMQAAAVVALAAISHAIGSSDDGRAGIFGGLIGSLGGWVVWAAITYFIGAKVFKGTATWGELARTLGFAQSPGLLYVLGLLPVLGGLLEWVIGVWILIAGIIAIRQALDVSTGKAVVVAIIGWLVLVIGTMALTAALWPFR